MLRSILLACLVLGTGCTDRSARDTYEPRDETDPGTVDRTPAPTASTPSSRTTDPSTGLSANESDPGGDFGTRSPTTSDRLDRENADTTGTTAPPVGEPGTETRPGTGEVTGDTAMMGTSGEHLTATAGLIRNAQQELTAIRRSLDALDSTMTSSHDRMSAAQRTKIERDRDRAQRAIDEAAEALKSLEQSVQTTVHPRS